MQAVVLIGGKGRRLHPTTYTVPKILAPLRSRPYLCHIFRHSTLPVDTREATRPHSGAEPGLEIGMA